MPLTQDSHFIGHRQLDLGHGLNKGTPVVVLLG